LSKQQKALRKSPRNFMSIDQVSAAPRSVTRAQRRFGRDQLAALNREDLRKLCHGLILAEGAQIERFRSAADFDEFAVVVPTLWHAHQIIVRIFHRAVTQRDIDDIQELVEVDDAMEALILQRILPESEIYLPRSIRIIPPDEIAARITASALVRWEGDIPTIAPDRLELDIELSNESALLDPVGIQWLPSLALNELPSKLQDIDVEPQVLLERKTFRVLNASFRFSGVRYGESEPGRRLPDAVLHWPDGSPTSAMLDCKAAASGYRM
jgi:hypothetical protein